MKVFRWFLWSLVLACGPVMAEMKPGLWEHKIELSSESGRLERQIEQVKKQLEALPESQREAVEQALAKQGMAVDFANQTYRACVTEAEAERGDFDWSERSDCEHTTVESGGSTRIEFRCPDSGASGELVFDSDTAYSGRSTMPVEMAGESEEVTVTHSGQRVSADCP